MRGRLAVDQSGKFTALSMQYDADLGAYISPVAAFANINNPLQSLTGCYAIPAAHAVFRLMHTHAVPTGPYRGAGRPEMALLVERLVDLAARRLEPIYADRKHPQPTPVVMAPPVRATYRGTCWYRWLGQAAP